MPIDLVKSAFPSGKTLKGNMRKKFEVQRIKVDIRLSELIEKE